MSGPNGFPDDVLTLTNNVNTVGAIDWPAVEDGILFGDDTVSTLFSVEYLKEFVEAIDINEEREIEGYDDRQVWLHNTPGWPMVAVRRPRVSLPEPEQAYAVCPVVGPATPSFSAFERPHKQLMRTWQRPTSKVEGGQDAKEVVVEQLLGYLNAHGEENAAELARDYAYEYGGDQ